VRRPSRAALTTRSRPPPPVAPRPRPGPAHPAPDATQPGHARGRV